MSNTSGTLTLERTNGTTTTAEILNGGDALKANVAYYFHFGVNTGDTIDFQYSASATFLSLIVTEIDFGTASPPSSVARTWNLGAIDNPDTSVHQVNNYKTDIGQLGTYATTSAVNAVGTNVQTVTSTLGSPAQDASVKGITTALVGTSTTSIQTTLGAPAQDSTVSGVTSAVNSVDVSVGNVAQKTQLPSALEADGSFNTRILGISDLPQTRPIHQYSAQNVAVTANTNIV